MESDMLSIIADVISVVASLITIAVSLTAPLEKNLLVLPGGKNLRTILCSC